MEVVAASPGAPGGVPPFHDHDVREWSRIDSLTGVLERARLETDHWTANTATSCHKYGKVVDSRARTNADGALQQQARRQLEVFQSQIPGGHLQVIKTQTVSSSRWSSNGRTTEIQELPIKDFENLQLSVNRLDLSSQKSKANVGRGVGRRPPSRPRAKEESLRTAQQSLHRVSRLCHQIHDQAVKQTIKRQTELNGHQSLTRTKSTSSEDLHLEDKSTKSIEDLEDLEQLQSWRRTSKLRRSLQYPKQEKPQPPKPADLPENSGSVRKIREELEKGRRLSTALRGNNVDLEALDQILQTISSSSSNQSDKQDSEENQEDSETKKQKRNSFVTVETLQEVRGRLRRTSTPTEDGYKVGKEEETDDGIVTEENNEMPVSEKANRVRSYVYGMETMMNKKPILGTGSLESRSKLLNGSTNLRNEDWYNRRKSYGFEQVHSHTESSNSISLKSKGRVESSTDSGICRSSEIVIVPTAKSDTFDNCDENNFTSVKQISSIFDQGFNKDLKSTTITIPIVSKPNSNYVDVNWDDVPEKEIKRHSIAVDESKYVNTNNDNKFRRTSLAINPSLEDPSNQNRKSKKVEFCKTEVHFAAESGRVNIVETDEKPPPTNNFRRRRRNSGPIITDDFERNGLPVLHFGDSSYEKVLLGVTDNENTIESTTEDNIHQSLHSNVSCGTVTVNSTPNQLEFQEEEKKDLTENVKGILKNKPIKPTPYHLGEDPFLNNNNSNSDSDSGKWGVRLKPVQKTDPPYWKSTVTLHNTVYGQEQEEQPEFQKLLRNLRPTSGNRPDLISDQKNEETYSNNIKFVTNTDNRRLWSVADKVRLTEENKVYSTKVNFGDGGAAVVENDRFEHNEQNSSWRKENPVKDDSSEPAKNKYGIEESLSNSRTFENEQKPYKNKLNDGRYSPVITRRSSSLAKRSDLRTASASEKLSSPSLVGRSSKIDLHTEYTKETDFANVTDVKLHQKLATNEIVLRQPRKSEMTYFGVNVSPKPTKKAETVIQKETKLTDKPDLLQHMKNDSPKCKTRQFSPEKQRSPSSRARLHSPEKNSSTSSRTRLHSPEKNSSPCSRTRHRSPEKEPLPIYENIPKTKSRYGREFDKNILDELTKAADQILQAVNGFSEDDSQNKPSGDERNLKVPLDTITESKSWSHDKKIKTSSKQNNLKTKLKYTSSTSSVESLSKEKKLSQTKKPLQSVQTKKKSVTNESSSTRATTKARRLQRASSREALLQSHGSSSEDLGTTLEVPHRKPRQIKKTKLTQLTVSNGIEMKNKTPPNPPRRRRDESKERTEHLQEIRHKTAVSTIKSTAEKSSRDRSKSRTEESKKKVPLKRESSRGLSSKTETKKTVSSREISNHRISTANIKKCHRADGRSKH